LSLHVELTWTDFLCVRLDIRQESGNVQCQAHRSSEVYNWLKGFSDGQPSVDDDDLQKVKRLFIMKRLPCVIPKEA